MITTPMPDDEEPKHASLLQVIAAVASGFFGVRRRAHHDAAKITPVQVIIVGVMAAAIFVTVLLVIVHLVLSQLGTAA